jgi:CheY-like chemotaxis protein
MIYGAALKSNKQPITVVVADDHPLFREALAATVRRHSQLELVGEAVAGRQALDLIRKHRPDVAVLDLRMPDLDGGSPTAVLRGDLRCCEVTPGSAKLVRETVRGIAGVPARAQVITEAIGKRPRGAAAPPSVGPYRWPRFACAATTSPTTCSLSLRAALRRSPS